MGLVGSKSRELDAPSPVDLLEISNVDTGVDACLLIPALREQTGLADEDIDRILDQALRRGVASGWKIWREAYPEDSKTLAILIQRMIAAEDPMADPLLGSLMGVHVPSEWSFHVYNPYAARLYISQESFKGLEESMVRGIYDEIPLPNQLRQSIQRIYLRTDCNQVYWNRHWDESTSVSLVLRFFMDVYPYDNLTSGLSLGWIEYRNKRYAGSTLSFG